MVMVVACSKASPPAQKMARRSEGLLQGEGQTPHFDGKRRVGIMNSIQIYT